MAETPLPYSEKVMDHFRNPRNVGVMENPSGVGKVGNSICGDVMELFIKVENSIITDAKFRTFGCGAAISTSSMITELVKGKSLEEALKISNKAVAEALGGLPPIKMHCSVLAEEALKAAIDDYRKKQNAK
jgi:nitrogen fixation NifU-like protein